MRLPSTVLLGCLFGSSQAFSGTSDCARVGEQLQAALGGGGLAAAQAFELCWSDCEFSDRPIVANACQALRAAGIKRDTTERKLEGFAYNNSCAPMEAWDQERVRGWLESRVSESTVKVLFDKGVDGASLADITKTELIGFGIPLNESTLLLKDISTRIVAIRPGFPITDPCSEMFGWTGWQIWVNIFVEKLLTIDEQLYEFSVKLWVFQAYLDDRIPYLVPQANCKHPVQDAHGNYVPSPACADLIIYDLQNGAIMPTFFSTSLLHACISRVGV
jgi:hypothetical protein